MPKSSEVFLATHLASSSEAHFRAMSDASPLGIFVSDRRGNCIYTNSAYHNLSGQTLAETLGTNWLAAIHPDDRQRAILEWGNAVRTQEPFVAEVRFVRKNNSVVWTRLNAAAIRAKSSDRRVQGYVQIVENIGDRKAIEVVLRVAEDALFEQQESARVTLNSIGDGVLTITLEGKLSYLNHKAELMTGWHYSDAAGHSLAEVFNVLDAGTRKLAVGPIKRALKENRTTKLATNNVLIHRAGHETPIEYSIAQIHNRDRRVIGAVIVFHDVSDARARSDKMVHLAQHDVLTGLPNRALLTERLTRALGIAQRNGKKVALLFIDLDNFKKINDSLGHFFGDKLLQSVAKRLEKLVRNTDTVCRQGGDEFVILLTEIERAESAAQVANKLLAAFAAPHLVGEHKLTITLSIGGSIFPDDSGDLTSIFKHADTAMYHAKLSGRNNVQFFQTGMQVRDTKDKPTPP